MSPTLPTLPTSPTSRISLLLLPRKQSSRACCPLASFVCGVCAVSCLCVCQPLPRQSVFSLLSTTFLRARRVLHPASSVCSVCYQPNQCPAPVRPTRSTAAATTSTALPRPLASSSTTVGQTSRRSSLSYVSCPIPRPVPVSRQPNPASLNFHP